MRVFLSETKKKKHPTQIRSREDGFMLPQAKEHQEPSEARRSKKGFSP